MFSLVIAIIAIALVGVLALATIWYGTDAYKENLTTAGAAQIINETEQIEGAILAFNVEQGTPPNVCDVNEASCTEPLSELIEKGYLSSAPAAGGSTTGVWSVAVIDSVNNVEALVKTVSMAECAEANNMMEFIGVDSYNSANDPDLTKADIPTGTENEAEMENLIPVCAADMPSQVVCCQTI